MGISFNEEQLPNAMTHLKFRHLPEKNHIGEQLFRANNYVLEQGGVMTKGGMKCHIGADSGTGYVHTVTATSAH